MKTILRFLFVATLAVFFINQGFTQTTAKSGTDNAITAGTAVRGNFVDQNNDGVCDHQGTKGAVNRCSDFVDKDGDGICDNRGKEGNCCKKAKCQGDQHRHGSGQYDAKCSGHGAGKGNGPGNCCPNKAGTRVVTPSETPDPEK